MITTNTKGAAHGNSEKAQEVAAKIRFTISHFRRSCSKAERCSFASGGEFVTYCRHNPDSVAFIVHVPELRKL